MASINARFPGRIEMYGIAQEVVGLSPGRATRLIYGLLFRLAGQQVDAQAFVNQLMEVMQTVGLNNQQKTEILTAAGKWFIGVLPEPIMREIGNALGEQITSLKQCRPRRKQRAKSVLARAPGEVA